MFAGGIGQIIGFQFNVDGIVHLGYPRYLGYIIGTWKILAAFVIILPGFKLAKEWAYAGLLFVLSGATISHLASGDTVGQWIAPFIFTIFTIASWYLRPATRQVAELRLLIKKAT